MSDEKNKSLNDWGIDVDRFKERAKESLATAKGDLSEITGTLRQTLVSAKEIVSGLQTGGAPAAAELKAGFERAWQEIEAAFKSAREKARPPQQTADATAETPAAEEPAEATDETQGPTDTPN
jgi:peptidoglycan hydrolase CwlO-like protein